MQSIKAVAYGKVGLLGGMTGHKNTQNPNFLLIPPCPGRNDLLYGFAHVLSFFTSLFKSRLGF